jgi:hypothetical protein
MGLEQIRGVGPPRAATDPRISRISAENLSRLAKQNGRCGDIHPLTGYVCVTQEHDEGDHMAVQIGGPNDGYVYATWH